MVAGAFGVLLVLVGLQLDRRRCEDVAREHALTLAHTAGVWLDGDAHAGLGPEPQKRLGDLNSALEKLLEASGYPGVVRTLRPTPTAKNALAASPGTARSGALDVVLQTGGGAQHTGVDYHAGMRPAFFDDSTSSVIADGRISAWAPVADSWGSTTAIVWVEGPASAPLWRMLLFAVGLTLFAGLMVTFVVWLVRRSVKSLEQDLGGLEEGVRQLTSGQLPAPFELGPRAPRELTALADALELLRARVAARASGQPMPPAPAPAAAPATTEPAPQGAEPQAPQVDLGEVSEFDLALLLQQLIEPLKKNAQERGVEVQLVFPDGVPSQVRGHAMALYRGLEALLANALRTTREGSVSLRVSRAGARLRFEVADTSPGVAFKQQQSLRTRLAASAGADPAGLKDPLELASCLAQALGGELSFESQPGQGSRFALSAAFQGGTPGTAPGFQPGPAARPQTTFYPRSPLNSR